MKIGEILSRLEEMAQADISFFLNEDGGISIEKVREKGHLIRSVTCKNGEILHIELHNAGTALKGLQSILYPRGGEVYLIQAENNLTKIGYSRDVTSRLSTLKASSPLKMELLESWFCEDAPQMERKLHELFQHKRVSGEWFELSVEDLDVIGEIMVEHYE